MTVRNESNSEGESGPSFGGSKGINKLLSDIGLSNKPTSQSTKSNKSIGPLMVSEDIREQRMMAFNKIVKSQIRGGNQGKISDFSQAVNAALMNSNFVENLQYQITKGDSGKKRINGNSKDNQT